MHLAPLIAMPLNMVIPIPFLPLLAAIVLYMTQRDKSNFVKTHGQESLNFQITLLLFSIVLAVIFVIFFGRTIIELIMNGSNNEFIPSSVMELIGGGIVLVLIGTVAFFAMIAFMIIGSVRANGGNTYRYPISIRFVK